MAQRQTKVRIGHAFALWGIAAWMLLFAFANKPMWDNTWSSTWLLLQRPDGLWQLAPEGASFQDCYEYTYRIDVSQGPGWQILRTSQSPLLFRGKDAGLTPEQFSEVSRSIWSH